MTTQILDLSKYDGREYVGTSYAYHPVDWAKAKAEWPGAIVKSSEGITSDPLYVSQTSEMKRNSVAYGAYHIFRVEVDPLTQANKWCDVVEGSSAWYGQLGMWADVEIIPTGYSAVNFMSNLKRFMDRVNERIMYKGVQSSVQLGVYTRASFIDPIWISAGKPLWIQKYPCWQAYYYYDGTPYFAENYARIMNNGWMPPKPKAPLSLPTVIGWQWTALGRPIDVPGYPPYKKAIDFNFWYNPIVPPAPPVELTDKQKLDMLWEAHPELHPK